LSPKNDQVLSMRIRGYKAPAFLFFRVMKSVLEVERG